MFKIILIAIEGFSEKAANWNYSLLRKDLENMPIKVVVPQYLDAKGRFARFRAHKTIEEYAAIVEKTIIVQRQEHPEAKIYVLGHSLGGLIARYLQKRNLFPENQMILVGTPNRGIKLSLVLKILAKICNVPLAFQIDKKSNFLYILNMRGIPSEAHYIYGELDDVVTRESSDPLNCGTMIANCGHKLFPREIEKLENSAIPVVKKILEKDLENK